MKKPNPPPLDLQPQPPKIGVFRSAITEADNRSVNIGYLSLFLIMIVVLGILPTMVCGAIVQAYFDANHVFPFAELGKGAGLVTVAFSTALGALGLFLLGDRRPTTPSPVKE